LSTLVNVSTPRAFLASQLSRGSMTELFHIAFPPLDDIARTYSLPSLHFDLFFIIHCVWKDLLVHRGRVIWRLARRDKTTLAKAALYQKLIDSPRRP